MLELKVPVRHVDVGTTPSDIGRDGALLWRSLNAALVFEMKNDPHFGGSSQLISLQQKLYLASIDHGDATTYQLPGPDSVEGLGEQIRSICAHRQGILIFSRTFQKWWWLSNKISNLSYLLARNRIDQESRRKNGSASTN